VKVISLTKTKELLGIFDSGSDAAITAKIPYIDSLVKRITNNKYNLKVYGDATDSSPYISVSGIVTQDGVEYIYDRDSRAFRSGINNFSYTDIISEILEVGQLIEGTGIPADTYIDEIFYNGTSFIDGSTEYELPTIKMSTNATVTSTDGSVYIGMNIAYQPIVAKGIQYLIDGTNTTLPCNGIASKSFGPVSTSYSQADLKINNKYGMPGWFIKAFPRQIVGY